MLLDGNLQFPYHFKMVCLLNVSSYCSKTKMKGLGKFLYLNLLYFLHFIHE